MEPYRADGLACTFAAAFKRMKIVSTKVGFLRLEAIVHVSYALAHLVQKASGLQWWGAGLHGKFLIGCLSSISTGNPGCKPLTGVLYVQYSEQWPAYRAGFALDITLGVIVAP